MSEQAKGISQKVRSTRSSVRGIFSTYLVWHCVELNVGHFLCDLRGKLLLQALYGVGGFSMHKEGLVSAFDS